MKEFHTCNHKININGVGCVNCTSKDISEMKKTAKEFLRLLKHDKQKETESHIKILNIFRV